VDSETGVAISQEEADEEAEVEEQLVAAVVAHEESSVVPAVEVSGKFLLQDLPCCDVVTILCVADVSGGAGGVVGEGAGARAGEGARDLSRLTREGVRACGGGRGRGRGVQRPLLPRPLPRIARARVRFATPLKGWTIELPGAEGGKGATAA
jgi:hypothetical protein